MARTAAAKIRITADADGVKKATRDAETSISRLGKTAKVAAVAGIAVAGTAIVKFGIDSVNAAKESEAAMARVRTNIERTGNSYDKYADQLDAVGKAAVRKGFDDEDAMESASRLAQKNKDVTEGIRLQALAMDVARGRNISLESATNLVIKAQMGQAGAVRRLGIDIDKSAKSKEILAAMESKFAGQADAYAKTQAGAADRLKVSWENFQESVGEKLIPIIAKLMQKMADFSDWLTENWPRIWAQVKSKAEPILAWLGPRVKLIMSNVQNAIQLVINLLKGDWGAAWGNVKTLVSNQVKALGLLAKDFAAAGAKLGKALGTALGNAFIGLVESAINLAIKAANGPSKLLNRIIPGGDPIPDIGSVNIPRIGGGSGGGTSTGYGSGAAQGSVGTRAQRSSWMATGGRVPGDPRTGDSVPAMLTPGEVVLNRRQQAIVGVGRVMNALAATGGKIGGGMFASGGLVNPFPGGSWAGSPRDHGARALGNWQSDNAWDIMGGSGSRVYAVAPGVITRISSSGKTPQFAGQGVYLQTSGSGTWWYKHISSAVRPGQRVNAGDVIGTLVGWTQGGPHLHLARDSGDPAAARGGAAPGGNTGGALGSSSTVAAAPSGPTPAQKAAAAKQKAEAKQKAATTRAIAAALKGIPVVDPDADRSASPSGAAGVAISNKATAAGRAAYNAGRSADEIREAMDDVTRREEIKWVRAELTKAKAEWHKVNKAIATTNTRLKTASKKVPRRKSAARTKALSVVNALKKKRAELLDAKAGIAAWIAELNAQALDLDIAEREDALEGQEASAAGGSDGGPSPADDAMSTPDPNLQAIADQERRRAEIAEAGQLAGDQFIRTALGPGDLSQGGLTAWQAAGGTLNVNVQTLHPGDPATLRAIIEAIARAANQSPAALAPGGVLTV